MAKNTIKLTESDLESLINESIKRILNEDSLYGDHSDRCYELVETLLQTMEPVSLLMAVASRIGYPEMTQYLEDIYRIHNNGDEDIDDIDL